MNTELIQNQFLKKIWLYLVILQTCIHVERDAEALLDNLGRTVPNIVQGHEVPKFRRVRLSSLSLLKNDSMPQELRSQLHEMNQGLLQLSEVVKDLRFVEVMKCMTV